MTVVKRQSVAPSGVSSEVEVLKALKSLFEHHKALDEKVRERLRISLEKNSALEEELCTAKEEIQHFKAGVTTLKENGDINNGSVADMERHNGTSQEANESIAKIHELQTIIEKQTSELSQWQRRVSDLNNKISECEENLSKVQKDFVKSQEQCLKLQRDLRESVAQKEDQVIFYLKNAIYFSSDCFQNLYI